MKKKLLSLALALMLALTLLPTSAFAEGDPDAIDNPPGGPVIEDTNQPADPPALDGEEEEEENPVPGGGLNNENPSNSNPSGGLVDPDDEEEQEQPAPAGKPALISNDLIDEPTAQADTNTHTLAREVEAVAPTCTKTGSIKYYTCATCSEIFSDRALTQKITGSISVPALDHNYDNGYCTRCGAKDPDTTHTHTHVLKHVDAVAATCTKAGSQEYWECVCGKRFATNNVNGIEITESQIVVNALGHLRPDSGFTPVSGAEHSYTCARPSCGETVRESHVRDTDGTCALCGLELSGSSGSGSGYRAVDITSVYLNSYSIDITWYSDEPSGTYFDIYVDGSFRRTVAPSKSSSGYFSYTEDFSRYLGDDYYSVSVYLHDDTSYYDSYRVYNRDYDYDYDYWYDHSYRPNGTPSTNSSGIPYASQVNGRYSASEAIRILRNSNHASLQYDLLHSNTASNSFSDLEDAVKRHNNVNVYVNVDRSDVPSAIRNIRILGAAFNASSTNSTVRLEVDAPSQTRYAGYGYQFSMSLTGVGNDSRLDVPVKITMPVPSDIRSNTVRILHFHNSAVPDVIDPVVSGSNMSFTLTGFSDFVITDDRADPYYYYYNPMVVAPAAPRRSLIDEHLAIALPIIASMNANGYIYDDVSPAYWAYTEIAWARDGGMMSGYYDGTFRPYAATTRQELWMVLARLAGARPADMWDARQWAMSAGISDGQYPHSSLSRQQMIAMLHRYAQYLGKDVSAQANLQGYQDVSMISGYARNAMAWAVDQGIIAGDATGCLHPQDIATRADFAVYLYRFIN